ncbi:MAG TPA: TonB-dependent receptor [Pyrinomonadaceae bacterium]|nr:TonB-dependent receptor [Pyrinomonadaceae bacterium]
MYSSRFKPALALLACLALPVCAAAQQRITGTVTDNRTHSPVRAATVRLEGGLFTMPSATTTDADGRFSFSGLSPNRYTLRVTADAFYAQAVTVTLAPREASQVDFQLVPLAAVKEQVTVRARTKLLEEAEAATVSTLDAEQLEALPAARRTQLTDVVTAFVSSGVAGHDNFVHLRGNELSLNTFINGVSFYDNPHQLFTPGLSPDVVQSVNVITGGFPAEFGNRFGGILDIVTRTGFDAGGHGTLSLGAGTRLRDNISASYGDHTRRFGYFLYAQGFESERFLNTPTPDLLHDFGKGARSFVQFDYHASTRDSLRLVATGDGTNFELPNTTEDERRGRDFFQRNREQTAILSWDHTFSSSSLLSTSLYERFAGARLLPTSDATSIQAAGTRNDLTLGAKSDLSIYPSGSRHAFKAGVDLTLLRLREDFSFDPRGDDFDVEPFVFRGRETGGQASAYFQDQLRVTKNLNANLGLRYDQYSLVTSAHAFSPRVNLAYAPGGHTVIHLSYNRFFSPPPIENLLLSSRLGFDGQPPQISFSNHFEAGASRSFRDRVVVRVTAYWRSDRNSFENTELANVRLFLPTTFARGKAYGVEFSSQLAEIQRLGLSGYFSYTAQRAFQTAPASGGFTIEDAPPGTRGPAAFDQIHTGVAGLTWRERRTGFFASGALEYGSGTPASLPDASGEERLVRLPEHLVANLYFGVELFRKERRGVGLQFNVENVSNRVFQIAKESEFTPVQYSPPRFISGSMRVRF